VDEDLHARSSSRFPDMEAILGVKSLYGLQGGAAAYGETPAQWEDKHRVS
jgi:hypothetical protein